MRSAVPKAERDHLWRVAGGDSRKGRRGSARDPTDVRMKGSCATQIIGHRSTRGFVKTKLIVLVEDRGETVKVICMEKDILLGKPLAQFWANHMPKALHRIERATSTSIVAAALLAQLMKGRCAPRGHRPRRRTCQGVPFELAEEGRRHLLAQK